MASDSSTGGPLEVLKRFRPQRTRLRVSACVAASRSLKASSDDETA
ncbi:hypothetical protein [Haloferax sp. CBA1149]|nr:hypothetical protein [Haloferax sp. CBA1149]